MNSQDKQASRGFSRAEPALSPEEIDANFRAVIRRELSALISREIWRAEMAARRASPPRRLDEEERRKAFARAIARLEFGRAYWDEQLARGGRLGAARSTEPRPRKK
jgi:hypothetical protein